MKRIAIIGAGISGLVLARELSQRAEVIVFEKARGVGGRMSTRYADPFYFDHGAQFFTARTPAFQAFLKPYTQNNVVTPWTGKVIHLEMGKKETKSIWFEPHFVASPNMNSLCKELAQGITTRTSCEVQPLAEAGHKGWSLRDKEGVELGDFDWVISTAPPVQTLRLFAPHIPTEHQMCSTAMLGCYTLMLGFNKPWERQWIAAKVLENPIQWIGVNSSKPGRDPNVTCLTIHSRNDWAEAHIDDDMAEAQAFLLEQFSLVTGIDPKEADYSAAHRWRYALADGTGKNGNYLDTTLKLAATGGCETSRIEEAWLHAKKLADRITHEIGL